MNTFDNRELQLSDFTDLLSEMVMEIEAHNLAPQLVKAANDLIYRCQNTDHCVIYYP